MLKEPVVLAEEVKMVLRAVVDWMGQCRPVSK
jgi:hypothetical protein